MFSQSLLHFSIISILAFFSSAIADHLIYWDRYIFDEYAAIKAHPAVKNWDSPVNKLIFTETYRLAETAGLLVLFSAIYFGIPPLDFDMGVFAALIKGVLFALLVALVQTLPVLFVVALRTNYPVKLLAFDLLRNAVGKLVVGIIFGLMYKPQFF